MRLLLIISQIIIGIPKSAVTLFIGNFIAIPGSCESISLKSKILAPAKIVAGIKTKWFDVLNIIRTICGIIIPIKPIGPQ